MQFQLSKEEKLEIENHQLKMQMLKQQYENQQSSLNLVVKNFCTRVSQKVENLTNLNVENGFVDFKDEEKKTKNSAKKTSNLSENESKK